MYIQYIYGIPYTILYAITNLVSKSIRYICSPTSTDPLRLLKNRQSPKASKYSTLVQSQGGEFSPIVIGTSGSITIILQQRKYFK